MAKNNNLTDFLTDIANTIRATDGTATTPLTDANKIDPQDFSSRIVNYQNKTVSPSTSAQTVTKDTGYMALGTVTVNAMPSGSATIQNRTSGGTGVGYGQEVSLTAGYYSAQKFYNNIGAGTIDVTDLTITPNALSGSWDSTNNKYVVRQASKTADMQSTVTTAGYVSSSVGTKNKGTATVSAPSNLEIPKAKFEASGASIKTTSAGAGYIPASTTVGTIASGSATGKAGDITYVSHTQDSTNKKKFTVTGSVSAPAPTISAGYVSSGTAGSAANKTVSLTITDAQAQAAVGSGSATTPATTIKINPTLSTTYTTDKGYLLSVSATQSVTPTVVAGYVASGTAGTITVQNADTPAYVAQNSFATGTAPSGVTPTNLAAGSVYRLSSGYYHADRYYKVPNAPSGNIELTKATSTDVAAYATATVKTGSATPSATVAGSSSALTSPTAMNNQYFTVTPTASVGTAGWISSISNGTQLKYKVKDGSLASSLSITADPSLPVWDSDLNHFKISVSKSQSVTPVSTAGWLGTAATSTVSVSGSMDPGTIEVGTTLSGTAAVTPVIQNKTASVSGKTQITASPTTSTTGISTYYMAVETPENLNPLMANPYIETNGYGTSDHFISSSDSTVAGANGSGTYYIPLATGGVSTSGGGLSKGTASGGGLSGGGLTAGAGEVSITQNPEVTPSVSRSYTVSGATDSTYGVTTTPPSSGDYATFDPNATVNKEAKAKGRGSVTRAAVTRAAFSQTVTRADVKDTRTAGYIPARASTTVISSDSTTVSLGADSTTIPQTSGTSNYSSESSSTTTVNAGTNIYIPVAAATATGGTASASASIAKQPNATATGGTATASASQTGMTAGVSDTATSYYFTSSASATGGNASAASGYSTASASATGGNASVSKGITAGASASGASSGNKSATSTEVTKSATGTSASDSSTIYLKAAAGSVTGSNLTGTNDVNVYTTDGSNAGVNISGVVGTKATTEPTSGYYLAFTGSSSATAQTQTAKVTTAGYTPTNNSFATRSVSYSATNATKYFPIAAAEFEVSGGSVKTKASKAGYVPANTTVGTVASLTFPTTTASSAAQYYSSIASITPSTADQYLNLPVGYNNSGKYYKINAVATGTATGNAGTITYVSHTQDSTNKKKFTVTGSVSAPAPTISAGYVSSGTAGSAANKTVSLTITDAQAQAAVGSGSATTPATTIKINPTLSTTYTTDKGYLLSVSATQSVTPTVVAGYVASGTAGTITVQNADTPAYVAQNSFATGTAPSGVTPTNLAAGSVYRLSSGYYHADRYYKVPNAPSGNIELTKATSTDVAAYATATVKTGSATPSATVAGSSSALTSPTAMNNQYFTVTPTASVGTAGWISSISNGTQLKYKVKDGSLASSLSITADPSLPVWDSDLNHFKISVSKSQSVTPVSTAGWLGTAATSTVSVSGSMDPGTIEVGTTLSGTAAVTPVIQNKTASVSGKTQITASPTTSTTGISTYYMAVETPENLNPLMANPYIETNGYGTSDHFISSSDSTVAGANGSGTYYIPLATGGVSTSGGGLSKGTASGGGLSGGGLTAGAGEVSITQNPEVTPSVSRSYTVSGATDSTYGVTTTPPSSGDYATFDPNATVNKEAKAKGRGSVTRAAVTRAAFSQTVTRADVKDTRTAGYIPARASTTVISSDSTTVSLGADSTTIPQTSGTSNYSSESSSTTTVNAGTNIYIPVAAATATGGTASASASIAKQPNATATGGTATASASQTGMTAGVSDTATSYYFTSSASATGGNASAASGYSTASASATGGNASVSKGITAGASASGASSGNKSATSTEVTKSATGTSASDSSTIYLKAAAGSVTGSNLTGTNDVNVYTTDGSNAGVNISGVVGTKATTEPTSGYYLAFTGSSSATAQTQTAKVTTAGYTPTNNSFATRSVSYSATNATKYFPIAAAEFEVSGGSVKTKASKAGYVPANTTVGTVASLTFPTTTASSAAQYYSSIASITPSTADQYLNLPVGYNNSGKYYKINAVATGTATGNAGTITYVSHTQDSTNKKKFTVTGTVTAPEPIVEPGYITTGTAGTQANRTVSLTITDAQAQAAVGSGSATTPATTITANPSTPVFNPETLKFDITVSKTQDVTPTVSAGYVSTGTAGTITVTGSSSLNMSQFGTTTDTPSSYTTLTLGGVYKLTAGYYNGDRYYKVPAGPSGNIQLTQATSTDVSTYATATVRAGSATPSASYATLSSAGTSPTSVTSQYFKITPTASVGIAGWISSINNGTVQNYTVRDKVGSSGSNTVYAINASLSDTNTSGISVSASSGGYTVSTSGWISTGTYGSANSGNKYLNNLMITPDKTLTAYVGYYDDPGGELDVGYNYGIIKIYDENCPDNPIVDMQGNEVSLPYGDSLDDPSYKQVTNQNGLLNQINLPTSTSGTASGSSVANITPGTSNQYLNLPEGYNVSNRYYIIKAVSNHSGAASSTTSGTIDIDNDHKANVEFTNTNNGIYVEPSASGVSRNYSVSTAGWIATGTYGDTSGSLTGSKYYINKITVPKDVPFAVDMKDDTTYDTTSYLTINNNTYRRISITNVSNSTVGVTSSSSNGTVNITQVNSINLGYNITNSTVQQSFTIPSLSIYSYNSSNKTTVTNLNNSANSVIGTYSGSGTIGTYTNTGTITNMSGSRTITTLGRSGSSGTLTISNNGYSLANTGTVNIITNAYGTVRIGGSTNADSKIYFINLAGTIPSGKTINSLENNGTITTLSGTGSIGTYSNTGSISYMTGSRTINYLGNSSNDGSIVINHLGYSSSHDGYVTIKESKYGFIEAGSANPSSSANPTWMLSYPMVSLADGASASTFRYLWFKVSSKPGRYLAAYKTSITGGASYYTNTFSSNTHTYLFDMSTTATRYFDLILFFDSPLGEAEVVTIGNASSSGTENGYNTEFTAPTGCNAVLFRMIRYSVTAGVYIDIHPTFIK